jgi:hypothetical protein
LECGVVEESERDAVKSSLAGWYRGFGVNGTLSSQLEKTRVPGIHRLLSLLAIYKF